MKNIINTSPSLQECLIARSALHDARDEEGEPIFTAAMQEQVRRLAAEQLKTMSAKTGGIDAKHLQRIGIVGVESADGALLTEVEALYSERVKASDRWGWMFFADVFTTYPGARQQEVLAQAGPDSVLAQGLRYATRGMETLDLSQPAVRQVITRYCQDGSLPPDDIRDILESPYLFNPIEVTHSGKGALPPNVEQLTNSKDASVRSRRRQRLEGGAALLKDLAASQQLDPALRQLAEAKLMVVQQKLGEDR